jgi:hypothetical protein
VQNEVAPGAASDRAVETEQKNSEDRSAARSGTQLASDFVIPNTIFASASGTGDVITQSVGNSIFDAGVEMTAATTRRESRQLEEKIILPLQKMRSKASQCVHP